MVSSPNHNFSFNWLVNLNVEVADTFANYEGKDKSLWRELATCAESTFGLVGSRQSFCLEEDHYRQRHHHNHHHHHYQVLQEVVNLSAQKITISCSSKCSSRAFDMRLRHLLIFANKPGIEIRCYQSGMKYGTSTSSFKIQNDKMIFQTPLFALVFLKAKKKDYNCSKGSVSPAQPPTPARRPASNPAPRPPQQVGHPSHYHHHHDQ